MREVRVDLGARSYTISLGYKILSSCVPELKKITTARKVLIISDKNVYGIYGPYLETLLAAEGYDTTSHIIEPGEGSKSWDQAEIILEQMLNRKMNRNCPVLALGGGVVGDLSGFVAGLYMRGVPLIQIPTSLLALVDSSIGGKVAVNHPQGKNMFGLFYQPAAVWGDLSALETIPGGEWLSGLAEVLKYGIIWDKEFFCYLEEHQKQAVQGERKTVLHIVEQCCRIKALIVNQDERDEGVRNILNFGHTIGHALESATMYAEYRHGEAVSIGMAGAMALAQNIGLISEEALIRVKNVLTKWGLPVNFPSSLTDKVVENLYYDKKSSGDLLFILPEAIGRVIVKKDIYEDDVRKALKEITY